MRVAIEKSNIFGSVKAQPSKSMAHRLLICAALSGGVCKIENISYSNDIVATINCLNSLGVICEQFDDYVVVHGVNILNALPSKSLDCNECGSTLRFFIPIALLLNKTVTFVGSEKLLSRPLEAYENLCKENNFVFNKNTNSLAVNGNLTAGEYNLIGNVSSQYISGMLFALSVLSGKSIINITTNLESRSYIDLTINALNTFGIKAYFENDNKIIIFGGTYISKNVVVEGDYSNAAFLDAFNYLGGNVNVLGLNENSLQGDKIYKQYFKQLKEENPVLDITNCPDLAPILFSLSANFNGATFVGTKRLQMKESDRANVMKQELEKLGASVEIYDNKVVVKVNKLQKPTTNLFGHNDHRIVMALSVLLTKTGGEIYGAEAVNKSYPTFFEDLLALNCELKIYEDN